MVPNNIYTIRTVIYSSYHRVVGYWFNLTLLYDLGKKKKSLVKTLLGQILLQGSKPLLPMALNRPPIFCWCYFHTLMTFVVVVLPSSLVRRGSIAFFGQIYPPRPLVARGRPHRYPSSPFWTWSLFWHCLTLCWALPKPSPPKRCLLPVSTLPKLGPFAR